jgi:hypothetical protein
MNYPTVNLQNTKNVKGVLNICGAKNDNENYRLFADTIVVTNVPYGFIAENELIYNNDYPTRRLIGKV